ncbi:hypothetical protein [Cellulomonas chengniuliangii]|uniref:Uncharacterized protein n=1 Tax=Cellulomonas chengniuliangii TaxID=2968084 RepID=A0ABY5L265_9CELL|nr:hypothetical protein [Cellulomonas chengniuliangii]MCC2307689.1 hypothetical protein [Cellulomonas chengniuliangii]UUI75550.1 hypothetical protein NP064_01065 [Cellulomonas chengniuliangii]
MTFLSAVLPGLRDFRTPFVVGCLWLLVGQISAAPAVQYLATSEPIQRVGALVDDWPQGFRFGAMGFVAYLVGLLALGVGEWLERRLPRKGRPGYGVTSRKSLTFVESSMQERLRPISRLLPSFVPTEIVLDEFELASLRLSKDAPEQFQQYDRVRAEAEFRLGVAPPTLFAASAVASSYRSGQGWVCSLQGR